MFPTLPPTVVVRAGMDEMPDLNASIDSFILNGLKRNEPITLLNLPDAHHAFDIVDRVASTQRAIDSVLTFFHHHLIR